MYTPLKNMKCQVFEATPIQGRHMFTSTLAQTQKLSLQCHNRGLPIIWWCFWNETCRRLRNYWGRLENILNSAAWRSQCRHSSSYHNDNIVHHRGCCESSIAQCLLSLASCGCCCARGRDRSGAGMTNWSRTRTWSRSMSITRSGGCSCGRTCCGCSLGCSGCSGCGCSRGCSGGRYIARSGGCSCGRGLAGGCGCGRSCCGCSRGCSRGCSCCGCSRGCSGGRYITRSGGCSCGR